MTADSFPYAPWATAADIPAALVADPALDAQLVTLGLSLASTILFNLTRLRWPGEAVLDLFPERCCGCLRRVGVVGGSGCDCGCVSVVDLERKVVSIESVTIDGATIDPARYELQDSGRHLVWIPDATDAGAARGWPTTQRLNRSVGSPGTWSARAKVGKAVPADGKTLAAIYGQEIARLLGPDSGSCRLSARTRSASRRGSSTVQENPMQLVVDGRTGLLEVDQWVGSINGGQSAKRATVRVPGRGGRRVHTRP